MAKYAKKGYKQTKEHKEKQIKAQLGRKVSEETRRKIGKANWGEKNGRWKGNKAKYKALHIWVKRRKPKPKFCIDCGIKPPHDLANISGKYKRDVDDYEWLYHRCHMRKDGWVRDLKTGRFLPK